YRWRATYSGDADNAAVTTACGAAGQSVTVTNQPPVCTDVAAEMGSAGSLPVTLDCTGASQGFAVTGGPSHGKLSGFDAAPGPATYTPDAGYSGTDSFTFDSSNDGGTGTEATVHITIHAAPTVTATASSSVTVGGTVTDAASVDDRFSPQPGATITFT